MKKNAFTMQPDEENTMRVFLLACNLIKSGLNVTVTR